MEPHDLSEHGALAGSPAGPPNAPLSTGLMDALLRFETAHARGSVRGMRACFHDEAIIESVASGGTPLPADETAAALGRALRDHVYAIGDWRYEELAPNVVLSITGARHLRAGSTMTDETVYRLISAKNSLMWRVKLFRSREEALAHLARHGPGLGLPADPAELEPS